MPRRTSPASTPREPRAAELRYIAGLRRVWLVVQEIIQTGLDPLLAVWPSQERVDVALPQEVALPGVTAYGRPRRIAGRQYNPGPFGPPLRRRITDLTDADLRRLWPGLDPQDVRSYAPWATSREEVYRISYPAGTEMREGAEGALDVQGRVRAGIEAERARLRAGTGEPVTVVPHRRPPSSFRIRRPVFTQAGAVMVPPMPSIVSTATIRRQMEWIELATHQVVTRTNLAPIIDPVARQTSLFAQHETERVLALDLRQRVPGLLAQINAWREANINLIESGIRAPASSPRMRPSLLTDVSRTVDRAHAGGLRVEELAGQIADRFGVSDSRAALIARDQTLKLNAQVSRSRQVQAGVRQYRWSTSGDELVRDGHAALNGTVHSWDNPPDTGNGEGCNHPGMPINCRCVPEPIPPSDGGEFDFGL